MIKIKRPDGTEHLDLFIPHPVCIKFHGRFHGYYGEKLEYVALKHVAEYT